MMTDCSDGFMITVLPVTSAALTMPHKIAIGKFHGAITSATPRRPVMLVAFFAGHVLREPGPAYEAHPAGVEGAEIDGFGNVAVRLSPWLAHFKDFERGKLESAALENFGGAFQQLTAFFKRSATPFLERRTRGADGAFGFGNASFGGVPDDMVGLAGIERDPQR